MTPASSSSPTLAIAFSKNGGSGNAGTNVRVNVFGYTREIIFDPYKGFQLTASAYVKLCTTSATTVSFWWNTASTGFTALVLNPSS